MAADSRGVLWNPDNVKDVAESVGISALNEEAVRALSQDVEYRLGQVIIEAMRFMHLGKRTVLGTQDISLALRALDVEPLYGYESTRPLRFGEASLGPGQPLFYIEDEEVDFEKLINAPLPKVPRDISFTGHWLAVEGVQPSIPQNPTTAEARADNLVAKGPGANPSLAALAGNDSVTIKPLVKHVVSKELILFFDKVRAAILDKDDDPEVINFRAAALASVREDPGLHQLVPYFVQFVADKVTHELSDLFVLRQMLGLVEAVVRNESLHIDAYVASLIPPILTCLIGRHLGGEDSSPEKIKEKYHLRDLAASLLNKIVIKYGKSSGELQTRLTRTCLKAFLEPVRTLGEHYGAVIGIINVGGAPAVTSLIIPNLKPFEYVLNKEREGVASEIGVKMLIAALMKAVMMLSPPEGMRITNGTNGHSEEGRQVEEYLGSVIGGRVAASGNHALVKAVLEVRDKQ